MQFRFTPLFESQWVEPYPRVGVNYLHKNFASACGGNFVDDPTGEAHWESSDVWNPDGRSSDKNSFVPLSFGAGVNAWLSNSFGLGLQGEYLLPVQKNLPHFVQARVIWRIGGKSKSRPQVVKYVEIEKPVEVEKIVERIVEKLARIQPALSKQWRATCWIISTSSLTRMCSRLLRKNADTAGRASEKLSRRPLPDYRLHRCKGKQRYNTDLSNRRAKRVYEALLERGVPAAMLKWHGIGKRASIIPVAAGNKVYARATEKCCWKELPI